MIHPHPSRPALVPKRFTADGNGPSAALKERARKAGNRIAPSRASARFFGSTSLAVIVVLLLPVSSSAQEPAAAERSLRDGVFTEEQAARGQKLFDRRCASCHMTDEFVAPAFLASFEGAPVSILYDVLRTSMPQDNPASLKPREYVEILTYLFRLNGVPAGAEHLESDPVSLSRLVIERPSGAKP